MIIYENVNMPTISHGVFIFCMHKKSVFLLWFDLFSKRTLESKIFHIVLFFIVKSENG